jgi:hypothetical protein
MTTAMRSRKVRRILRLEAQADRQATREARAAARATLLQRRVDALRTEARAVEASLNGSQRAELGRARACPAPPRARPSGSGRRRRSTDGPDGPSPATSVPTRHPVIAGPRCPVMQGDDAVNAVDTTPEHEEA